MFCPLPQLHFVLQCKSTIPSINPQPQLILEQLSKWCSLGKPLVCRKFIRPNSTVFFWQCEDFRFTNSSVQPNSYNRYLAVAGRVVRRSLKEEKRLVAERRGESDLRFAKWDVSIPSSWHTKTKSFGNWWLMGFIPQFTERQDGRAKIPNRGQRGRRSRVCCLWRFINYEVHDCLRMKTVRPLRIPVRMRIRMRIDKINGYDHHFAASCIAV